MSQEEFEEALTEICDDYCRHPRRSELSDDDLMEICNSCPLNKLRGNADEGGSQWLNDQNMKIT